MDLRPRVLFVGRRSQDLPLKPQDAMKWDALAVLLTVRVLGTRGDVEAPDSRFHGIDISPRLQGARFYAGLPVHVRRQVRQFKPDVIIAQSPYEAAMTRTAWPLRRPPVPIIAEVHGDWRTASRYYGGQLRRLVSRPADWVARFGLRSATGVRTVGPRMSELTEAVTGRPPVAEFPTWFDPAPFFDRPCVPLPARPAAVWIGVLEHYKNPQLLVDAWPQVVRALPDARLRVIGRGPLKEVIDTLLRDHPGSVRYDHWVDAAAVSRALDDASCLVLTSRSEGLPRVGIEAYARGRCIVGTAVDGIRDLVEDGHNGMLAAPDDPAALAASLVEVLGDPARAQSLGAAARRSGDRFRRTPEEYAGCVRKLVDELLVRPTA